MLNELEVLVQKVDWKNGFEAVKQHVEARHEVKHAYSDHTLVKDPRTLGFHDATDLEATVDEMFKWALSEPKRPQKSMPYELEKGLYDYWK